MLFRSVTGSRTESGCVFCHASRPPAPDSLVLHERDHSYVILNLYPYNNGHLMVVPHRHVASFGALSREELHEIVELVQLTEAVLQEVYTPDGLNVGVNLGKPAGAGVVEEEVLDTHGAVDRDVADLATCAECLLLGDPRAETFTVASTKGCVGCDANHLAGLPVVQVEVTIQVGIDFRMVDDVGDHCLVPAFDKGVEPVVCSGR
mgnify:CR=1 FL=1